MTSLFRTKKVLIALTFLLLTVICELCLRILYPTRHGHVSPSMRRDDSLGFKFIPNGEFKSERGVVKFNKYGYVDDDWKLEKDSSVYRVALVGACNLSGVFHLIDTAYYNFPELAEEELKEKNYQVEIMNFGVPGEERSYYSYKSIQVDVMKFVPDIVFMEYNLPFIKKDYTREEYRGYQLEYLINNAKSRQTAFEWADKLYQWRLVTYLINNCYIVRSLALKYQHTHNNHLATFILFAIRNQVSFINQAVTGFYTQEKSIQMVEELQNNLKADSTEFKVLFYNGIQEEQNPLAGTSIQYVVLNTDFTPEMHYQGEGHYNNLGQIHIKDKFLKALLPLIPTKFHPN